MKRAIALFLALVFVFALIPVSALAAEYTLTVTGGTITGKTSPMTFDDETSSANPHVGESVTVTATVPSGKVFKEWEGTNVFSESKPKTTNPLTFELPASDVTLTATFRDPTVTATNCTYTGTVAEGETIIVTPNAAPSGAVLKGVSVKEKVGGAAITTAAAPAGSPAGSVQFTMPGKDVTASAVYEYTIAATLCTMQVSGSAVTSAKEGEIVTVVPDTRTGYEFNRVEVSSNITDYSTSAKTFTMPAGAVTVTAVYDQLYTIGVTNAKVTATNSEGDTAITEAKAGTTVYVWGQAPSAGDFAGTWTNTGIASDQTTEDFTFAMPAGNVTLKANYQFPLSGADVTYQVGGAAATVALPGAQVTATATVAGGSGFSEWTATGMTLSDTEKQQNPLTFIMPAGTVSLTPVTVLLSAITMAGKTNDATPADVPGVTYSYSGGAAQTSGSFLPDAVLDISAPASYTGGYVFDRWELIAPAKGTIADPTSRTTTYTVGSGNETVTARYVKQVTLTVTAKHGGNTTTKTYTYKQGQTGAEITAPAISGYSFTSWSAATPAAIETAFNGVTNKTVTFDVPATATALTVTATYQPHYTLNVNGVEAADITINGAAASETSNTIAAGSTVTIRCSEIGARVFSSWSVNPDLPGTVDLTQKTLTFSMPGKAQTITANYTPSEKEEYKTGAYLEVLYNGKVPSATNQRYYAAAEYIHKSGEFDVRFYKGGDATTFESVATADLTYYVAATGTNNWIDGSNGLNSVGVFDLKVQYKVGGTLIATSVVYSKAISVLTARPEIIILAQAPTNTSIYMGDDIDMEGSEVWLRAADKHTTPSNYYNVRQLGINDYTVWPQWDGTTYRNANGTDAVKTDSTGKYIEIELAYNDPTQANAPMRWIKPADGKDRINIIEAATNLTLTAASTATAAATNPDLITPVSGTDAGRWKIYYGVAGTRTLTVDLTVPTGSTAAKETFISGWTNSDPSVAKITQAPGNPLQYQVTVISSGETTVTVTLKGSGEKVRFTLVVLSTDVENTTPVTDFELNPSSLDLYVGSSFAMACRNFSPSNASTVIGKWESVYADGTDASYSVSVDETGTVKVNHYTDQKVLIRAYPKYSATSGYCEECELTIRQVNVTNMKLTPAVLTMYNKASKQLTATLEPDGATDKTVKWTTSDSTVVSVDSNGIVTANKVGTATVTATSVNNSNVKKTCAITVVNSVLATDLTLNRSSLTLGLNETTTLTAYITPTNATTQTVSWSSDNTGVVKVDANGKLTSVAAGIATVTATIDDGSGLTASCLVTVSRIISNAVTLSKQTLALIQGDSEKIVALVFPSNVTTGGVKWTTSNSAVATVDTDGTIVGVGGGAAIVTATANDGSGKYADCVVAVTPKVAVESIALNLSSFNLLLNDSTTLTATVLPKNATYSKLEWSSSDTNVATVDEKGKVSGLKLGNSIITCKAGDKSVSITVTVANTIYSAGSVVNCARRVNVRSKASGASKAVGYAYLGDTYKVLDKQGRWFKIQYNATTQAFIWDSYLNSTTGTKGYTSSGAATGTTGTGTGTTTTTPTTSTKTITIINCTNCVNVRSGAGTSFSWVGYANLGETYTYNNITNGFYEIVYGDTVAYVSASFAKANG